MAKREITADMLDAAWEELAAKHRARVVPGAKSAKECAKLFGCNHPAWLGTVAPEMVRLGLIRVVERCKLANGHCGTGYVIVQPAKRTRSAI